MLFNIRDLQYSTIPFTTGTQRVLSPPPPHIFLHSCSLDKLFLGLQDPGRGTMEWVGGMEKLREIGPFPQWNCGRSNFTSLSFLVPAFSKCVIILPCEFCDPVNVPTKGLEHFLLDPEEYLFSCVILMQCRLWEKIKYFCV